MPTYNHAKAVIIGMIWRHHGLQTCTDKSAFGSGFVGVVDIRMRLLPYQVCSSDVRTAYVTKP